MPKFKPGDIVKGISTRYGVTNIDSINLVEWVNSKGTDSDTIFFAILIRYLYHLDDALTRHGDRAYCFDVNPSCFVVATEEEARIARLIIDVKGFGGVDPLARSGGFGGGDIGIVGQKDLHAQLAVGAHQPPGGPAAVDADGAAAVGADRSRSAGGAAASVRRWNLEQGGATST